MPQETSLSSLELRSKASPEGRLELSLQRAEVGDPGPGGLVVRVEAAPVNPSDLGMLLGPADPSQARDARIGEGPGLVIPLSPPQLTALARRLDLSLCPGLEGAGTVVAAATGLEHLLGRTVAMFGGRMYAQYRTIAADDCIVFPRGVSPPACAAAFVNPLTALGMLETLRREGHTALVHSAAASNLGQMLTRLCLEDGIDLISIVRREDQAALLRELGARYVCNSESADFVAELTEMISETGATLAFDAIGGGTLAATILKAMEEVYAPPPEEYSIYGSTVHKQVYVYGVLDPRPIEIHRGAGSAWSVSGWLMMNYLAKLEPEAVMRMKDRIVRQIGTTFRSQYAVEISLSDLLDRQTLTACSRRATGAKYLLNPHKSV